MAREMLDAALSKTNTNDGTEEQTQEETPKAVE
jgi:hypothetical protein